MINSLFNGQVAKTVQINQWRSKAFSQLSLICIGLNDVLHGVVCHLAVFTLLLEIKKRKMEHYFIIETISE